MSKVPEGAISASGSGCIINCLATPRASRNALTAWHDGRLKVALAAPPVDGEANKTLVKYIAEVLQVPKSTVSVVSGLTGRRKAVAVSALPAAAAEQLLEKLVKE